LLGLNTVVYLAFSSVTKKKSFTTFACSSISFTATQADAPQPFAGLDASMGVSKKGFSVSAAADVDADADADADAAAADSVGRREGSGGAPGAARAFPEHVFGSQLVAADVKVSTTIKRFFSSSRRRRCGKIS
jgi:hypothetical protein